MAYEGFQRPTGIQWENADRTYGQVKFGDDSSLVVLFYTKSVFDPVKSRDTGLRQYNNEVYVKIQSAGEHLNIIDRPVQEADKRRFQHQWNAFLQNRTQVPEGTPIDLLFPNNPAVADSLKALGVHTIQQCANLSANAVDRVGMGGIEWVNLAKKYLENASSGTAFLQLRTEVDKKDQEIKILRRQFEQVKAQLDDLLGRIQNPNASSLQPSWVEGYDAQAERLDANHPSQELKPSPKGSRRGSKKAPSEDELEQTNILRQVTEENIPTVDLTKVE